MTAYIDMEEIIRAGMKALGITSLCAEEEPCGCGSDDLMPCGESPMLCVGGDKTRCDESNRDGCEGGPCEGCDHVWHKPRAVPTDATEEVTV